MFGRLKQKIKNKKQKKSEEQSITPKEKKNKNIKLHFIYVLIILNLIIWTVTCVRMNNFYQDYVNLLINNAHAQEQQVNIKQTKKENTKKLTQNHTESNKGHSEDTSPTLGSKEWILWKVEQAGIDPVKVNCLVTHESHWNPNATNLSVPGNVDLGLFQWSTKYQVEPGYISIGCTGNVVCETKKFIEKVKHDGNFSAWHSYTDNCRWLGTDPFIK